MKKSQSMTVSSATWHHTLVVMAVFVMISNCSAFQSSSQISRGLAAEQAARRGLFWNSKTSFPIHMSKEENYDLKSIKIGDRDFWTQQKELAEQMVEKDQKTLKEEQRLKYEERANALVADSAFFMLLIFPLLWFCFDNPLFSLSYLLGASFGLAYCYGLGKYVSTLGGSVDDMEALQELELEKRGLLF